MAINKLVRSQMLTKRKSLTFWQVLHASRQLVKYHKQLQQYRNIAIYLSYHNEISPNFLQAKLKKANLFVPVLAKYPKDKMVMQKFSNKQTLNRFQIQEPFFNKKQQITLLKLDLILLPLTAFNDNGDRLGFGGGFYDRFLAYKKFHTKRPHLMGLAYSFQQSQQIQKQVYDIPLNSVMTEKQIRVVR
jgi:5-formyltetrahydrofolate cyclo-ligase